MVLISTFPYRMTSQELAVRYLYGARRKKTYLLGIANKKGADQPARLRSLISAFFICLLESLISKLAICEFSLVSLQGSYMCLLNVPSISSHYYNKIKRTSPF